MILFWQRFVYIETSVKAVSKEDISFYDRNDLACASLVFALCHLLW